ncbi:MAG: hypothetical protein IJW73_07655 [Candidatus Gastranaerophilales bacterium]|nr:hypothetical protein [Candidatus Gastranaerophilales bacterium]
MADNLINMWGLVSRVILVFFAFALTSNICHAKNDVAIITDTMLTPVNYYNAYFRTPEFFAVDLRGQLIKKDFEVATTDEVREALKKAGIKQNDLLSLVGMQQGYNLDFSFLKKIAKNLDVDELVILTMGMDIQRDFLKNTAWNAMNVPGWDVVNPTHRVSVYVAYVDIKNEVVLWETIYAKNIRNNKMKNLDTAISNNYEGMLRLKEYSKYISPDIAFNVKMKSMNPNFVEPATYITKENIAKYAKDRHNIGSKKELSEIEREKWDTEKLKNDTKENIIEFTNNVKDGVVNVATKTKDGIVTIADKTAEGVGRATKKAHKNLKKSGNSTKNKFTNWINRTFKKKSKNQDWFDCE